MRTDITFEPTHDVNMDHFAELVIAAQGRRSLNSFAKLCGVSPSTLSRIINKTNKGASSIELIQAIADNAAINSGVSLQAVAYANGYTVNYNNTEKGLSSIYSHLPRDLDLAVLRTLLCELEARGGNVINAGIIHDMYASGILPPRIRINTNVFEGVNTSWFIHSIYCEKKAIDTSLKADKERFRLYNYDAIAEISMFYLSVSTSKKYDDSCRFSVAINEEHTFYELVDVFAKTEVPIDFSIILVDTIQETIIDEFIFPHTTLGNRESYFIATERTVDLDDLDFY